MMQPNWLVTAKPQAESRVSEQAQHFSYVDNWLFMSACGQKIRNSISVTEAFAAQAGYVISPGKPGFPVRIRRLGTVFALCKWLVLGCLPQRTRWRLAYCYGLTSPHVFNRSLIVGKQVFEGWKDWFRRIGLSHVKLV